MYNIYYGSLAKIDLNEFLKSRHYYVNIDIIMLVTHCTRNHAGSKIGATLEYCFFSSTHKSIDENTTNELIISLTRVEWKNINSVLRVTLWLQDTCPPTCLTEERIDRR